MKLVNEGTVIADGTLIEYLESQRGWRVGATIYVDPDRMFSVIEDAPVVVSMRQARLALLGAGVLAQIDAAIAAMPGVEGEAARIEWEYATEVRRDSQLVAGMAAALALDDATLDTLFATAAGL
jgi:hypothetical protein